MYTTDGTRTLITPGDTWTIASDTVLKAEWTTKSYVVSFDANRGTVVGLPTATATYSEKFILD